MSASPEDDQELGLLQLEQGLLVCSLGAPCPASLQHRPSEDPHSGLSGAVQEYAAAPDHLRGLRPGVSSPN